MNDVDVQVIALVGRFVAALAAIACGALFVRWGANLYLAGVKGKSGSIRTVLKDAQFILSNGAPGTFLSAGGVIVMVTALMTMPEYDKGRVANARPNGMGANPLRQQLRPPSLAAITDPPPADTLDTIELTGETRPMQGVDASTSPVRRRDRGVTSTPQLASNPRREQFDTVSGQAARSSVDSLLQRYYEAFSTVRYQARLNNTGSAVSFYSRADPTRDGYALMASRSGMGLPEERLCPPSMGQAAAYSLQTSPSWEFILSDLTRRDSLSLFPRETPPLPASGGEPP